MKLKLNHMYSREEISDLLGGEKILFLPNRNGKIICGCFRLQEKFNPGAPEVVLFGRAELQPNVERAVQLLLEQGNPTIPIFIFRKSAQWEYIGDYRFVCASREQDLIDQMRETYPKRGAIRGILYFEKA